MLFKRLYCASTPTSSWCHHFHLLKLIPTRRKAMKLPMHNHETKSTRILQKKFEKQKKKGFLNKLM